MEVPNLRKTHMIAFDKKIEGKDSFYLLNIQMATLFRKGMPFAIEVDSNM